MKYKHQAISLVVLPRTPFGVIKSQCTTCDSLDCSHRVEFREVSIFGTIETIRCLISNGDPYLVQNCEGYTVKKH